MNENGTSACHNSPVTAAGENRVKCDVCQGVIETAGVVNPASEPTAPENTTPEATNPVTGNPEATPSEPVSEPVAEAATPTAEAPAAPTEEATG